MLFWTAASPSRLLFLLKTGLMQLMKLDADALVGNVGLKLGNSQVYPVYPPILAI